MLEFGIFEDIRGWFDKVDGELLYKCAMEAPALPFLELGSYCGKSTCCLALAAKERGLKVYAVDAFLLDSGNTEFLENMKRHDFLDVVMLIEANYHVLEAVTGHVPQPIGLLHIDGGHTEYEVRGCLKYESILAPGGMLIFHDSNWDGVDTVIKDAVENNPNYELVGKAESLYYASKAFRRKS